MAGDLWRVRTLISGPGAVGGGVNEIYFNQSSGIVTDAVTAVAQFWDDIKAYIDAGTSMAVQGDVEEISSGNGQIVGLIPNTGTTVNGTSVGDILPPATQGLLQLRTGVYINGRELRGRINIPAPTESNSDGGPAAGYITAVNGAGADLLTSNPCDPVVYSRTHFTYASMLSAVMWTKFAVLRSRRD